MEKALIKVFDKDKLDADDFMVSKEVTIPDKLLVGFTFELTEDLKKKAVSWLSNGMYANLYFTVEILDMALKVIKNNVALPLNPSWNLRVDDNPRCKAYFSDNNDTKRYSVASQTTPVFSQIKTTGYQDNELLVEIWESITGFDKKLIGELGDLKPDKFGMLSVPLDLKKIKLKDASETKQLYIKVLTKEGNDEIYSSDGKYTLTLHQLLKTEAVSKGTTKAMVVVDVSEKNQKNEVCHNCEKDITSDEMKEIFPNGDNSLMSESLPYINEYFKRFGIDTCLEKAYFFAQVKTECGFDTFQEGFNYYWESLINTFGKSDFGGDDGERLAKKYGRLNKEPRLPGVLKGDQKEIANIAYGTGTKRTDLGNETKENGWKYSGKGILQVTGKYNYKNIVQKLYKDVFKTDEDFIGNPELLLKPKYAVGSAIAFWNYHQLNTLVNNAKDEEVQKDPDGKERQKMDAVSKKINSDSSKWKPRWENYIGTQKDGKILYEGTKKILKVYDCLNLHPKKGIVSVTDLLFPLKSNPLNIIGGFFEEYNFRAAQKANMATYKYPRDQGARLHAARDLYTEPNTEVYSMASGIVTAVSSYYFHTDQITIQHDYEIESGKKIYIRYAELDPSSITLKVGAKVVAGLLLGKTGFLKHDDGSAYLTRKSKTVYMMHLEIYKGTIEGSPPNNTKDLANANIFKRREDLIDPLALLEIGYKNSKTKNLIK